MPIKVSNLKNNKRTVTGEYFGDTFEVVYRPNGLTPTIEDELREAASNKVLVEKICGLIVQWDVLGEDGKPLPIKPDVLKDIDSALLVAIIGACREDMAPKVKSAAR